MPHLRTLVLLLPCLALAACAGLTAAQKDATTKFASALSNLGDAASTELVKMHDETVAMNIAMFRLPDLPPDPNAPGRVPIVQVEIKAGEYGKLSGRFAGDWYDTFSSGPQALKAYGQALTDIMNADNTTQIKQSSDSLAASLKAIPGAPISATAQSAISSLSQELSEYAVAAMKAHAVKKIIAASHDPINTVCDRIGYEFTLTPVGQHQNDNFAADFRSTAQDLVVSSKVAMDLHPGDREVRSDALSVWLTANQSLTDTTTVVPGIFKSSGSCKSANDAVVKTLNDPTPSLKDIEDFYSQGKQLYSTIQTLGGGK